MRSIMGLPASIMRACADRKMLPVFLMYMPGSLKRDGKFEAQWR
jgi:hypothetical protein